MSNFDHNWGAGHSTEVASVRAQHSAALGSFPSVDKACLGLILKALSSAQARNIWACSSPILGFGAFQNNFSIKHSFMGLAQRLDLKLPIRL